MKNTIASFLFLLISGISFSQSIPANFPVLEENGRRSQIVDSSYKSTSFFLRPILADTIHSPFSEIFNDNQLSIKISPFINTTRISSKRPYGWGDNGMIPNPGFQTYFSGGVEAKYKFINLTFRPEIVVAQNKGFLTHLDQFTEAQLRSKFFIWNWGDFPEKFGDGWVLNPWWGQSKLTFQYGSFEIGASTQNIWWGSGQWNSLTFSNNSQGFPHITFNTIKPVKTFIGNFETQLIIGQLKNSGLAPSQYPNLNEKYFTPFSGDWRYLNALMVSYNPKWIPNLYVGFARTFQVYNNARGDTFYDWLPVFEAFQKEKFFDSGHSVGYDGWGQDQQMVIFGRYLIPKAKAEIYFEYGRRDHAYNWREFILNPEHARAYILGFNKLFDSPLPNKLFQIRGEMTHQQESVNRYIRHGGLGGLGGGLSWHTHNPARGFVQNGQPLGVGIGVGSNVQTLEFSLVEDMDKIGFVVERLVNNQDFYYKAQLQDTERKPWVDLSIGFLFDKKWDNLLLSSKLQFIQARNYQWQLDPTSTPDFPKGENLTSFMAQTSLIYFWNKGKQ
ncbi:capsule assembly Wzi family protein [Algoriphagus sp. D3-2-R+10]|uniref:capsule assembly Wzi family protein n=1 Tax=Algoriphagus aurantiacus TaxID=3103948 RepID=UPI002B37E078|nr:capsule assembly Wzi family protein [Algoriphagus sp. D3-2-R+10]MEB2778403.1 capsule assembly Wzi family protein [Algoriphagus sp. D3-2-R+10]